MSQSQIYSLWILLEGYESPRRLHNLTFDLQTEADLSDLAPHLISRFNNELANVSGLSLKFFNYDDRTEDLPLDTTLKVVEQDMSATKPLVVRYPLSGNTIVINLRFLGTPAKIRLPHTTGVWYMLLAETKEKYERLQEDENKFYFVDQETKKETIDKEFTFNDLVKKTKPDCEDEITINLLIRIKGL
ncbi:hypothetical protein BC936DRAFT_144294 [Jimgerdemannia flammicorona]|uniref:Uncharacterized protein n=1 Tax=Jimgerdemannia flammicorona TaxID=994334 RepID=A0A432ZY29_9FUNG|nr:hypothetical protein BC936DRAFT_144294 [Jimgerdemannia flammicorona]